MKTHTKTIHSWKIERKKRVDNHKQLDLPMIDVYDALNFLFKEREDNHKITKSYSLYLTTSGVIQHDRYLLGKHLQTSK